MEILIIRLFKFLFLLFDANMQWSGMRIAVVRFKEVEAGQVILDVGALATAAGVVLNLGH